MTTSHREHSSSLLLRCRIHASKRLAAILAQIVESCARDLGQSVLVEPGAGGNSAAPTITLVLPAEWVVEQHHAWCLACRLACFCPDARVSVLVTGAVAAGASAPGASATAA